MTPKHEFALFLAAPFAVMLLMCVAGMAWEAFLTWYRGWRATCWTYGMCSGRVARRHYGTGEVQHIIWKAGEQGHSEDCWIGFDRSWWPEFKAWRD